MQKKLSVLIFSGLILATSHSVAADKAVATVNGKSISQNVYEHYLKQANSRPNTPQGGVSREIIINELVNRELLYQAATKEKMEKDPDVIFQMEQLRINTMIQGLLAKMAKSKQPSEADMKAEYDKRIGGANMTEFKARHILLKTEEDAKTIIAELDSGSKFDELAKTKSTGPSAKDGGDLGWFNPGQMVPEFSQAVAQMKKGDYSKTPVKTQFGWHVIKLEDTRKPEPPKFEDVKNQIAMVLQNQQIQDYIENLRKSAKIEIK
ncbi:MAG: peptidylprolyl isomerase [Gammaproteobacteria bacterium]|nr:peptidylprolyl isomerase [Gammaproteobacteria bacterium]